MKTIAVNIMNLCVPCENRCRYCLLSWDGKLSGVNYARSERYARRFHAWAKENRPDLMLTFGFGYSMEHPDLLKAIDFQNEIGSPMGKFLQFDGMKFRTSDDLRVFLTSVQKHGVELIDLTFYGTREYHDRFAARKGDFDFMMEILKQANAIGLAVSVDIPMTHENADQIDSLIMQLEQYEVSRLSCFIPHQEGRGAALNKIRFRQADFDMLSDRVRRHFNTERFKTEAQWIKEERFSDPQLRSLYLSLTPENMDRFEKQSFEETIAYLEELDDSYYHTVPSLAVLAKMYGDPNNGEYYSERDLYLKYQRRYLAENQLEIYDINDDRQCSSRRF